ncbi:D-glycero-beta-D-manno-heptose 1-phosphate adenylyltransferase [Desulfovibrio inopinatus]|uniref:D-glycero-beta-D-manno-heptose 1-phosphate adenylyltransferase n=1 Tax=Desulfovibrio inopinatus TaxID=102109 RepID=UPI0004154D44|nr:D-glycero-beta-D-manno-heptose 1-phosphate adenylyltransferase [Desulfovibrio inopinatus]
MHIDNHAQKIVDCETCIALLRPRRERETIVFTNGCFDLLHPGHVDLLERARAFGHILVLGLNTDSSVQRLKGPSRPVTPLADRALVLSGLSSVDYIVAFDEDTPFELISKIAPDVLIKGGDYTLDQIVGRDVVEQRGGTVYSLPLLPGYSTTATIARILQRIADKDSATES